jgi:hypothetical protein
MGKILPTAILGGKVNMALLIVPLWWHLFVVHYKNTLQRVLKNHIFLNPEV